MCRASWNVEAIKKRRKRGREESVPEVPTAKVVARFSVLPEAWPRDKEGNKGRHVDQHKGISVLRSGRELELASLTILDRGRLPNNDPWWGTEIHFPPQLDEAMGGQPDQAGG